MSIITLTTDFGTKDHFVAKIKAAIISDSPETNIVDISHKISPFNIMEAAYVIENSYKHFPEKTIHIIGVDSEKNPENKHLVVKLNQQYFICADNGIMSIVCNKLNPDGIYEINIHDKIESNDSALKTFTQVAWHLAEVITDQTAKSQYWREIALGTATENQRGGYFRQAANIDAGGQTPSVVGDYLLTDIRA